MIDRQAMNSIIPAIEQPGPSVEQHDRAVRMVLRLAAERRASIPDLGVVCAALGLSLDDALRRSQTPTDA